jgi:DNA-binding LytR/AlgR family response regulator
MKKTEIIFHKEEVIIPKYSKISSIPYKEIIDIICDTPYLKISRCNGNESFIFYPLEELIQYLPATFVLCNRSAIINLLYVDALHVENTKYFFVLKTGEKIAVPRRKRKELIETWKNYDHSLH